MRDRSCITPIGQSSRGAAGSSSRQMENVLAPLHALDPQYFFSCQHGKEPGKPAAQFQGYVIPRTCKPGRPEPELLRVSYFVWKWSAFLRPGYNSPTVPAANEVRAKILCYRSLYYTYSTFLNSHNSIQVPNVLIHRACVSAYIFLFVICKAVEHHGHNFPRECCRVYSCSGKTVQFGLKPQTSEGLLGRYYSGLTRARDHWADVLY